jgi:putative aldouronate transport system permease protein
MVISMAGVKRMKAEQIKEVKVKITWKEIVKQRKLILLSLPFVLYVLLFNYVPLIGWVMAFQKYKPKDGFFHSRFVGLDNFEFLFVNNPDFIRVIRNTLAMGVINLILSFAFAIAFALVLNEVVHKGPKKLVQTISYLPHFLSMIIVTGIVRDVLSIDNGIINDLLIKINLIDKPINYLTIKPLFWWIVGLSNVWKETGWNSIIYLSAITAISPDLYEAASIDGAGRLRKMWNITLPGIKPTIFILLLINVGNVLNAGFEIQYLLGNGLLQPVSQTIDIYVLKYGISQANYSIGTAAGIFRSVVSIILIFLANSSAKAAGEERLF